MLQRCFIGLLLLMPAVVHTHAADNWPQFRGPNGDGISDAVGLPTRWNEKENVKWKTPLHDKGWSSPVVWGDQIWVTAATEDGKRDYFAHIGGRNPARRIGTSDDVANAVLFAMTNTFMTGMTLKIDGGEPLV